jgi:transposase
VRLIAAQFVRPFVKSNKNDYCDAEAIAEAVERENMRFVTASLPLLSLRLLPGGANQFPGGSYTH